MQPGLIPIIAVGVVTSITAITAAAFDRFNKPSATICVLLAGSVVWIPFLGWSTAIPEFAALAAEIGFYASAPLFVIATLLFKSDSRGEPSMIAARLSAVGVIAGGAALLLTLRLLSQGT